MGIGSKIRRARLDSGMSQDELAKAIGCSRNTISRWESDKMSPTVDDIAKISKVLKIEESSFDSQIMGGDRSGSSNENYLSSIAMSIEDLRLDLLSEGQYKKTSRKTVMIILLAFFITVLVIFVLFTYIWVNWPAKYDNQPIYIEKAVEGE